MFELKHPHYWINSACTHDVMTWINTWNLERLFPITICIFTTCDNCIHILFCSLPCETSFFSTLTIESKVTIEVFSLPPLTNTGEIEAYFEKQGDNIEVLSTVNLGDGNARVELCGLTSEGIR